MMLWSDRWTKQAATNSLDTHEPEELFFNQCQMAFTYYLSMSQNCDPHTCFLMLLVLLCPGLNGDHIWLSVVTLG